MITLTSAMVEGLVGSCLVKQFDGSKPIAPFHREWWDLCTSDNRFVALAAPRGHSKSTSITISYTLAEVLFRSSKFVVLVSDSEYQACMFLGQIKFFLTENADIIKLFKIKKNDKGVVEFEKETESDIIVEMEDGYKFRIIAKGSEQKLRGMLWNGSRPDLMVLDDMESDEQVLNKERREKFRKWFYGALMPALSEKGKIRYVGTVLHQDSMLELLMPKQYGPYTVHDELKTYQTKYAGKWRGYKYKAHNEDFSHVLWPERWSADALQREREEYILKGLPEQYSQEYLNIPLDESRSFFKRTDFINETAEDKKLRLNYYISGDFAISEKDRADYTVFCVAGMDENGMLHIRNVIRDRMDGQEIVETMLALQRTYNPLVFGIEETQITKAIGPYLNRAMIERNTYINVLPMKPHRADKVTRAQSIRARMRAGGVKVDKNADWYATFEDELMNFPRSRHDDQVDSIAYMGLLLEKMVEASTNAEVEEEEYQQEVEKDGSDGRDSTTGY
jgi:predicted phage terminase large subunit-like protein